MQYVGFLAGGYRRRWSRNSWRRRPSGRCQRNGNAMGVAGQEGPFRSAIYPSAIEAFETAGRQGGGARDWPKNGSLASRWDSSDDDDDPGRTPDPICERVDRVLGRVGPDGHFNGFKHLPPLPPPQRRQRPRSIATRQSPSTPEGACAASPCWRCRTRHEPTPSRAAIHRVLEAVIRQGVLPILRARHCSGSPPLEVVAERLVDSLLDPTAGIDATLATIEAIVRPCAGPLRRVRPCSSRPPAVSAIAGRATLATTSRSRPRLQPCKPPWTAGRALVEPPGRGTRRPRGHPAGGGLARGDRHHDRSRGHG